MATIGVYGATGYTGQHVARWLAKRGHRPILAGRDRGRLERVAAELSAESDVYAVDLDDAARLRAFASKCDGIVHCAGPFSRYGAQVVNAAVEARTPYVDHASQPEFVHLVMREFSDRARAAGIAVVPALSFYTGLADLMVRSCAPTNPRLRLVAVAYHVDGWRPTAGTLVTGGDLVRQQRVVFCDNEISVLPPPDRRRIAMFDYPEPVGRQPVIAGYAGCCEPITVPRHATTQEVQTFASVATFSDAAFTQRQLSCDTEPGSDAFMVVVELQHPDAGRRRAWLKGTGDIYGVGALASVLGVERLVSGEVTKSGVLSPGEAFGDGGLLDDICRSEYVDGGLHLDELTASPNLSAG